MTLCLRDNLSVFLNYLFAADTLIAGKILPHNVFRLWLKIKLQIFANFFISLFFQHAIAFSKLFRKGENLGNCLTTGSSPSLTLRFKKSIIFQHKRRKVKPVSCSHCCTVYLKKIKTCCSFIPLARTLNGLNPYRSVKAGQKVVFCHIESNWFSQFVLLFSPVQKNFLCEHCT